MRSLSANYRAQRDHGVKGMRVRQQLRGQRQFERAWNVKYLEAIRAGSLQGLLGSFQQLFCNVAIEPRYHDRELQSASVVLPTDLIRRHPAS